MYRLKGQPSESDALPLLTRWPSLKTISLEHPELEVVITTDEEVGMKGAHFLDVSDLKASYLLNLDNESEGQILTSCAGGMKSRAKLPARRVEWQGIGAEVKISGLKGGHSGAEIHCGRANANRLLGRFLFELSKELNVGICDISGGMKDNAIPREAQAKILLRPEDASAGPERLKKAFWQIFRMNFQYRPTD